MTDKLTGPVLNKVGLGRGPGAKKRREGETESGEEGKGHAGNGLYKGL
jgi:hypothetical protein